MFLQKNLQLRELFARAAFLFSIFGLLLLGYTLVRAGFYFFNSEFFQDITSYEIFLSFLSGIRFDLSALIYINIILVFCVSLPYWIFYLRYLQTSLKFIFVILNTFFFFLGLGDIYFFPFQKKHVSKATIFLLMDSIEQIPSLLLRFWWLFLVVLLIGYALYQLYSRGFRFFLSRNLARPSFLLQSVFFCFIIFLGVVGARGVQKKVITIMDAYVTSNYKTALLVLSGPFTFLRSFKEKVLKEKHYFHNNAEIQKYLESGQCQEAKTIFKPPRNVVLILLESFGIEFLDPWDTSRRVSAPYLALLVKEGGAFFKNAYAQSQLTANSIPGILAGLPNWMPSLISKTPYISVDYPTIGNVLRKHGYRTFFLKASTKGATYVDQTVSALGIREHYVYHDIVKYAKAKKIPRESYDSMPHGGWGVFDEYFFLYAADMLDRLSDKPFFATLLTASAHHPFVLPKEHEGKFPEGENPYHSLQAYVDYSLKIFFDKIKKKNWAKDTLFVITTDHTSSQRAYPWNKNFLSRRRIPIVLYWPGRPLNFIQTEKLAQHFDIFPTILDFLNIKGEKMLPFGRSLLASCKERHLVLFDDPNYWIVTPREALFASEDFQISILFQFKTVPDKKSYPPLDLVEIKGREAKKQRLQRQLQAYIQRYNNGLIHGKLLLP